MIDSILRFFSTDAEVRFLRNQAAHVISAYGSAKAKIQKAQRKAEAVRENTVAEFEATKKATYERTRAAVERIKENAVAEFEEVEAAYLDAADVMSDKVENASELLAQVEALNSTEHPLP